MAHLQLANHAHLPTLLEMMEAFYAIDGYSFNREMNERNMGIFIGSPKLGRLWLICDGAEIIGYLCATFSFSFEYGGKNALIDEFFIEAAHRGRGAGRKALAMAEHELMELGMAAMHLEVEPHNERGNRLYIRQGFKAKGRILLSKRLDKKT